MDGLFDLNIEYTLQHAFEEKGIFQFKRTHVGANWITDITNKKNGGGNGNRFFPEMEFHGKADRLTMMEGSYNSARFQNVKLDIKRDPGKKVDGTLEGTFLGKTVKITLHGTRDAATHKIDGTLTVELGRKTYTFKITGSRKIAAERELDIKLVGDVEGQTLELSFAGKRTEWTKFSGILKMTYGQAKNYKAQWSVDRTSGTKVIMKVNTGIGADSVFKYSRSATWDSIMVNVSPMGSELVALVIKREITDTWNRKTTIQYRGGAFPQSGGSGKIILQVEAPDAHTKRFSVTADHKKAKEVLKYVNTITHNVANHGGHQEFTGTMKANLDLKDSSVIHKFLCKNPSSIHSFNHREADVSLTLNLDEPWHMLFAANLKKDGSAVVDAKIDTKSHHLSTPHSWHLSAPRLLPFTLDAEVRKAGNNIVGTFKVDNVKKFEVTLASPDGKSPYEVEFEVMGHNYKVIIVREPGKFINLKVMKDGPKIFEAEVDRRSLPRTFKVEYPASIAFLTHVAGSIDGHRTPGKNLHIHFHPGKGKDIEIDLERTAKDAGGKHERHFKGKLQRNKEVYYEYDSNISFGGNPAQFELDADSHMKINANSLLHMFACGAQVDFLCFTNRNMETKFRADKTKPYKMNVHSKVDKDGAEVFRVDMQTQTSPYKLTFNWPRMRAIVAPYRNGPLEITANHNPGNSLEVTSNIQGLAQFSVVKMPNGQRKVSLNNKELISADIQKSGRTITQSTTLPDGRALTTTFKWGNDYNIHRTGKYANNGGIYTLDVDGTALWKGNNVKTDVFLKLDSSKVGNGKLDAISAKLIKVVDGQKYEINVTDGKMAPGDFVKVGAFFRDL